MKKQNMDQFFIDRFNKFIFVMALAIFLIGCIAMYITTSLITQQTVKKKVLSVFSGVNSKILTPENKYIRPVTNGIIGANEMIVVYRGEKIEFTSPMPKKKDKLKEITLLVSKNENDKRAVRVKLYLDMKERVRSYYQRFYLIFFPVIFIMMCVLALLSVRFVRRHTGRLYGIINDLKDFETLGLEFNQVKALDGADEAAIISKEYNRILKALRNAYDKERQFVYDAAHELRVPLVKIEGSVNLLDKKGFSEEGRNLEKEIMKGCLHEAKTLIDNMLDLTNETIIVKEKVTGTSIAAVVNDVVESYRLIYEDFAFNMELADFEYQIRKADIVKLLNVIIDNGIKYSRESQKQIDIKIRQDGEKHLISVKDYGVGMSPEQQHRIFDIFWRADASRGRDTGGVGMGMTIAKKLCERYGLGISVNSAVDNGTTIELEFS